MQSDKFVFAKSEITFDGIALSDRDYKIQDKALNAIKHFKELENLTNLQSFQGMAIDWIAFTKTCKQPLQPLSKKIADRFNMTEEQTLAFQKAKGSRQCNCLL